MATTRLIESLDIQAKLWAPTLMETTKELEGVPLGQNRFQTLTLRTIPSKEPKFYWISLWSNVCPRTLLETRAINWQLKTLTAE